MENKGGKRLAPTGEPGENHTSGHRGRRGKDPRGAARPRGERRTRPGGDGGPCGQARQKPRPQTVGRLRLPAGDAGGGIRAVQGAAAAGLCAQRLHGDHHPHQVPAGGLASALCGVRSGAGPRRHRHLLGRGAEQGPGKARRRPAGETLSFKNGYTYVNGEKLDESYLPTQGITTLPDSMADKTFTVPEDCMFVMGDNRTGSNDSRLLGEPYIPVEAAQARMLVAISVGSDQSWQGVRWIG